MRRRTRNRHIPWLVALLACGVAASAHTQSPPPSAAPDVGAAGDRSATDAPSPGQPPRTNPWRFRLVRGAPAPCRRASKVQCSSLDIIVENTAQADLECIARVTVAEGQDKDPGTVIRRPGVVPQGRERSLLSLNLPLTYTVTAPEAGCRTRAPLPPLMTKPECLPHRVGVGTLADYYPAASRRIGEEGPVIVQFTLPQAEGKPLDVEVVGSSLFERLDKAAVSFVQASVFQAPCPGGTYRIPITFALTR